MLLLVPLPLLFIISLTKLKLSLLVGPPAAGFVMPFVVVVVVALTRVGIGVETGGGRSRYTGTGPPPVDASVKGVGRLSWLPSDCDPTPPIPPPIPMKEKLLLVLLAEILLKGR